MEQVVIVGSGCAGLTAAIYAARADLNPIVLAGELIGGQLSDTTLVENYPGFEEGVMGPDVMEIFKRQAERFGARVKNVSLKQCEFDSANGHKLIFNDDTSVETRVVIITTGARPRMLGLESEEALRNRGVSYCATCDGALYRNVPVAVVGGGDSAMEEALFLSRFASQVTVIHRRDQLRASKAMQQKAMENDRIEFIWDSVVQEVHGVEKGEVTGLRVLNRKTNESRDLDVTGLFPAIGHIPDTAVFEGMIDMDEDGYITLPDPGMSYTSVEAVFAGGDCCDHRYRQAVTAAGMGCRAAIDTERWLQANS